MNIEVLRFATQEVLEGQLNGPKLEQSFSFAQAVEVAEEPAAGGDAPATYTEYVGIYDDSQAVYVEVPVEWAQVDGSNWIGDDGSIYGSSIIASTDIEGFSNTFTTPGMQILAGTVFGDSTMGELARLLTPENQAELLPRFFGLSTREAKEVAAAISPRQDPPRREVVTGLPATRLDARDVSSGAPTGGDLIRTSELLLAGAARQPFPLSSEEQAAAPARGELVRTLCNRKHR